MPAYCTVSGVKSLGGITISDDDTTLELLCEAVSDAIDSEARRGGRLWYTDEEETIDRKRGGLHDFFDNNIFSNVDILPSGRDSLRSVAGTKYHLAKTPIVTVSGVSTLDTQGNWTVDTRDVYAYNEFIAFDCPFAENKRQGLRIQYRAGFFEPTAVPNGLRLLSEQMALDEYNRAKQNVSSFIKSKKIGQTAYTFNHEQSEFGAGKPMFESIISKYRRPMVYGNV